VLGEIDLDPASCEIARQTVRATRYFTLADNGLRQEWHGRVFLNPPYSYDLIPAFVDKLVEEINADHITAAIMLTNNSTDTEWFQAAYAVCNAICFTSHVAEGGRGRIHFTLPEGVVMGQPTQGQCFMYFGDDVEKFGRVFADIGLMFVPYRQPLARDAAERAAVDPEALADVIKQVPRVRAANADAERFDEISKAAG
jgi:ParB family transcriptional regulator, chromosome partitioning protein